MRALSTLLSLLLAVVGTGSAQQVADPSFDPRVANPAFMERHPKVLFDEAHFNYHTAVGRYKPFADLIAHDGYAVSCNHARFSPEILAGFELLIVSNALGAEGLAHPQAARPAFTPAECRSVRDWVAGGGRLLLMADHAPMGAAAATLAEALGVDMSKGYTSDGVHYDKMSGRPGWLVFSEQNGLLGDHPIIRGRNQKEQIHRITTFLGQSLKGPPGSVAFLKLSDSAVDGIPPDGRPVLAAGRSQGIAFRHAKGRVVVMGEAAVLSAQLTSPRRTPVGMNYPGSDNRQLALNIVHWLSGLLDEQPSGRP
jgi:hypothetical protein